MTLKIPPPPTLAGQFQQLNRWLLEIQSILNNQGNIDPSSIAGLTALFLQVAALQIQVDTNTANIVTNTADIATNAANIVTNTNDIAALAVRVTALEARSQILNGGGVPGAGLGINGDLYINNSGGAGTRLYSKIAGAWVATA